MRTLVVALVVAVLLLPDHATAQEGELPFSQGRFRVSVNGGTTFGGGGFGLGAGFGYYVIDGLELGIDGNIFLGSKVLQGSLAPSVRYLLPYLYPVVPYLGVFYRHTFIEKPWDDQDHLGGRVGLLISIDNRFMLGGGLVMEYALTGCTSECLDYYPELTINFTF